jgi:hypothetical protein
MVQRGCAEQIIVGRYKLPGTLSFGKITVINTASKDGPIAKDKHTPREAPDEDARQFRGRAMIAGGT